MKLFINGESAETRCTTLGELLRELDYSEETVATAVNGAFVGREQRQRTALAEGMKLEIVAPMQGG